jgi:hypothetical protein
VEFPFFRRILGLLSGLSMISRRCRTSLRQYLVGNVTGLTEAAGISAAANGAVLFDPELFKNKFKILDHPLWREDIYHLI